MNKKLSVVVATKNEEKNIGECLRSVHGLADEVIVVDEYSDDKTVVIAKNEGAEIYKFKHNKNFHETKQFGINKAKGDWILVLDADERVSKELLSDIRKVISGDKVGIEKSNQRLFGKHEKIVKKVQPDAWQYGEVVGYFIPRINYFVGKPLIHAGVYPDGVIRLFKNGKGRQEAKHVHEQIKLDGNVAWLNGVIEHHDSPTLKRYLMRLDRYTIEHAEKLKEKNAPKNILFLFYYAFLRPVIVFGKLFFRHGGYKDGLGGFLWSAFSASHYTIACFKYYTERD